MILKLFLNKAANIFFLTGCPECILVTLVGEHLACFCSKAIPSNTAVKIHLAFLLAHLEGWFSMMKHTECARAASLH